MACVANPSPILNNQTKRFEDLGIQARKIQNMLVCIYHMDRYCQKNSVKLHSVKNVTFSLLEWNKQLEECLEELQSLSRLYPNCRVINSNGGPAPIDKMALDFSIGCPEILTPSALKALRGKLSGGAKEKGHVKINSHVEEVIVEDTASETVDELPGKPEWPITVRIEPDEQELMNSRLAHVKDSLTVTKSLINGSKDGHLNTEEKNKEPQDLLSTHNDLEREPISLCTEEPPPKSDACYYWRKRSELRSELEILSDQQIDYTVRSKRLAEEECQMKRDIAINKRKQKLLQDDIAKIRAELEDFSVLPQKTDCPIRDDGIKELFKEIQKKLSSTIEKRSCLETKIKETAELIRSQKREAKSKCSSIKDEIKMRSSCGEKKSIGNKLEETTISNYSTVRYHEVNKELESLYKVKDDLTSEIKTYRDLLCCLRKDSNRMEEVVEADRLDILDTENELCVLKNELNNVLVTVVEKRRELDSLSCKYNILKAKKPTKTQESKCITQESQCEINCTEAKQLEDLQKLLEEREQFLKKLKTEIQMKKFVIETLNLQIDKKQRCAVSLLGVN